MKKISTLIFDLDGTAIPNKLVGMPSQKVIDTVGKAKDKVFVSVATGRPYWMCQDILNALEIEQACILNGGTQIFNPKTQEIMWIQEMDELMMQQVKNVLVQYDYLVGCEKDEAVNHVFAKAYEFPQTAGLMVAVAVTHSDAVKMTQELKQVSGIVVHQLKSWTVDHFDIHISHELATKKHAMQALLASHNLAIDEVMVVGDGGNDLPLFELAGWKVAMGNAVDELKEQADWIAPSVDEDGLAVAIEKFILS